MLPEEIAIVSFGSALGAWIVFGVLILLIVLCVRGSAAAQDFCRCWLLFWRPPECLDLLSKCIQKEENEHLPSKNQVLPIYDISKDRPGSFYMSTRRVTDYSIDLSRSPSRNDAMELKDRPLTVENLDVEGYPIYTRTRRKSSGGDRLRLNTWASAFLPGRARRLSSASGVEDASFPVAGTSKATYSRNNSIWSEDSMQSMRSDVLTEIDEHEAEVLRRKDTPAVTVTQFTDSALRHGVNGESTDSGLGTIGEDDDTKDADIPSDMPASARKAGRDSILSNISETTKGLIREIENEGGAT